MASFGTVFQDGDGRSFVTASIAAIGGESCHLPSWGLQFLVWILARESRNESHQSPSCWLSTLGTMALAPHGTERSQGGAEWEGRRCFALDIQIRGIEWLTPGRRRTTRTIPLLVDSTSVGVETYTDFGSRRPATTRNGRSSVLSAEIRTDLWKASQSPFERCVARIRGSAQRGVWRVITPNTIGNLHLRGVSFRPRTFHCRIDAGSHVDESVSHIGSRQVVTVTAGKIL